MIAPTALYLQIATFLFTLFTVRIEGNATWNIRTSPVEHEEFNVSTSQYWSSSSSSEPTEKLRRNYNLQDFLWASSGDGPAPSEDDGGLAWEDNGGGTGGTEGHDVVQITTTKTLFKTVLSTVYPVEYTPTLMLSSVTASGRFQELSSLRVVSSSYHPGGHPHTTPIVATPVYVTPPASVPAWLHPSTGGPGGVTPTEETHPDVDRLYWVQTVIKANRSLVDTHPEFQCVMQKNLARVYASAFKRHLLNSLGVLEGKNKKNSEHSNNNNRRRRRKRSHSSNNELQYLLDHREDIDSEWFYSSNPLTANRIRTLATTAMNVTVTIMNISEASAADTSAPQQVVISYVVFAEGNPVLASSAVQDLNLVSRQEMEHEIGYEVINKAEALVASPLHQDTRLEEATSPWLIVAVTTIILMVLLIVIIIYMVWKWKHNRLGDTIINPARPQSGIEEGVVNPAFLGPPSPIERSEVLHDLPPRSASRTVSVRTSFKSVQEIRQKRYSSEQSRQRESQEALASELNALLASQGGEKLSPSSVGSGSDSARATTERGKRGSGKSIISDEKAEGKTSKTKEQPSSIKSSGARQQQEEEQRQRRSTSTEKSKGDGKGTGGGRRRRGSTVSGEDIDDHHQFSGKISAKHFDSEGESVVKREASSVSKDDEAKSTSFPGRVRVSSLDEQLPETLGRSMDKISFGNLDVYQDSLARPISAKARKLLPKHAPPYSLDVKAISKSQQRAGGKDVSERKQHRESMEKEDTTAREITEEEAEIIIEQQETKSVFEQDRDIEESLEHVQSTFAEPATKDAEVQTPTRKPRPKAKPRKRVSQLSTESLVSTESEETVYVHEFESSPDDLNPMGRMRKRFHQFLDDAFNIMGKREDAPEEDGGRSKSARVSISHLVETREKTRPWTSQTTREESLKCHRPKSASFGPPKPAWDAAKSPRRCQSAKSRASTAKERGRKSTTILERTEENETEESDITSTPITSSQLPSTSKETRQLQQQRIIEPVFPHYPIYPDVPVGWNEEQQQQVQRIGATSTSKQTDPAVPLILAIKEEIRRFEKVKAHDEEPNASGSAKNP